MNTAKEESESKSTQPSRSRGEKMAAELEQILKDFNRQIKEDSQVSNKNILKALIKHDHNYLIRCWSSTKK